MATKPDIAAFHPISPGGATTSVEGDDDDEPVIASNACDDTPAWWLCATRGSPSEARIVLG
jgi:hypothetical protein